MKRVRSTLFPLMLAVLLIVSIVVPAAAVDMGFNGVAGESAHFQFFLDYEDVVISTGIAQGNIDGMQLAIINDCAVALTGTPVNPGDYHLLVWVETERSGSFEFDLYITIEDPKAAAEKKPIVVTKNPTSETVVEGGTAYFVARAENVGTYYWEIAIGEACIGCEDLPAYLGGGVTVSGLNTDTLAIGNIPMSLNGAYVWCQFVGEDESVCSTAAQIFVTPGVPVVTMQPVNETVMEGGEATFTSTANYDTGRQWILVSPDGATYDPSALSNIFPDLQFAGTDQDSITLTNVPLEMDGYRIFCRFTSVGTADSNMATLYVTPNPEKEPVTEPTTEPTTAPPTEPPTEEPTEEPEPTSASKIPSSGKEKQKSQKADSTVLLIIVAIIAVAAVAIAAIVAFVILKLRKK